MQIVFLSNLNFDEAITFSDLYSKIAFIDTGNDEIEPVDSPTIKTNDFALFKINETDVTEGEVILNNTSKNPNFFNNMWKTLITKKNVPEFMREIQNKVIKNYNPKDLPEEVIIKTQTFPANFMKVKLNIPETFASSNDIPAFFTRYLDKDYKFAAINNVFLINNPSFEQLKIEDIPEYIKED